MKTSTTMTVARTMELRTSLDASKITRKGGLKRNMIYLRGQELASMYETCPSSTRYAGNGRSTASRTRNGDGTLFAATRKPK